MFVSFCMEVIQPIDFFSFIFHKNWLKMTLTIIYYCSIYTSMNFHINNVKQQLIVNYVYC